jgi:ubiquinone biosynthesis protein COQ9
MLSSVYIYIFIWKKYDQEMSELINLRTYVDTQIKTVIKKNDINNEKA